MMTLNKTRMNKKNKKVHKISISAFFNKKMMCATMLCAFLSAQNMAFSFTNFPVNNEEERVLGIERVRPAIYSGSNNKEENSKGQETTISFNLSTVVDSFLNLDSNVSNTYENLDEKARQRQEFIETTKRFNQGNVSVAYNDYSKIVSEIDNDIALIIFAKSMYEVGFFTLGDVSLSKVKNQTYFEGQINHLKKSYKDNYPLDKQEEIYLAKAYSSIYFDNTPEETAFDLSKKTSLIEKSDYANFVMAQALLESRQYQQALMFIDEAIRKNPENPSYICYKAKILNNSGKSKEALKYLEKYEISDTITPEFRNEISIEKERVLANLSNNENDKRFHLINVNYLKGDYYKAINECQNILNFNKNNYKILTLQAQSQLNVGKDELAKKNLLSSLKLNKNYAPTLSALGDISYLEGDNLKAAEYYKKAAKLDKNDLMAQFKLLICYKKTPGNEKTIAKIEKQIEILKGKKSLFYEYYLASISILKNDKSLKREYLLKSLAENLLFENAQNAYLALLNENKRYKHMENFLHMISFTNNYSYGYYYYKGLSEMAGGSREQAKINMKYCISINPDFEPADKFLSDLDGNVI